MSRQSIVAALLTLAFAVAPLSAEPESVPAAAATDAVKDAANAAVDVAKDTAAAATDAGKGLAAAAKDSAKPAADAKDATKLAAVADATVAKTPVLQTGVEASLPGGLLITRHNEGDPAVRNGDVAYVHYVGVFTNGIQFDSSRERGKPIDFRVGDGRVIRGWEEGVLGMTVGEKRRLVIPAELAYGKQGAGMIPPGTDLTFEIELMGLLRE